MKRIIRVFLVAFIIAGIIGGIFYYIGTRYEDEIYLYYRENILKVKENLSVDKNTYYKNKDYIYVQNTDDFVAKDKKHLLNIFYTVVNSGANRFTFYCDDNYKSCINDILSLIDDKDELSNVNNFVHPYNSFKTISTSYDDYGQVDIKIEKVYTDYDKEVINNKVNEVISSQIKDNMTDSKKVRKIHDYIINHAKYATETVRKNNPDKEYNKANDVLLDGYGLCSSYADAMAIFLYELGIDNYKIASDNHIWNLVNVGGKWLHLDLTWDDPIISSGKDRLEKMFFLINDKELKKLKVKKHDYDKSIYAEAS